MKKIIEIKDRTITYTNRIDMLIDVDGEIQHHYITVDWLETQGNKIRFINDYVAWRVKYRNLTQEERELEIKVFESIGR